MALDQTIIGTKILPDKRIMEYGARDPVTGQRYERILPVGVESTFGEPPTKLEKIEAGVKEVQETFKEIKTQAQTILPPAKPIAPEVDAEDLDIGAIDTDEVPTGEGADNTGAIIQGFQASLDAATKAYQDALQQQRDDFAKQIADSEAKIADIETKQKGVLEEDIKPLLEPFREEKETAERKRLKVEENYFANQKSISELQNLLTQGQTEIEAIEGTPGLAAIKTGQINKKKEDIAARAGILQAVMSARSGQIHEAYTLIDRSIAAINADRKDQLSYYEAVYNFYQEKKDTEGKKLITLEEEDRNYIEKQIDILAKDVEISQDRVEYIKDLMMDPRTAGMMDEAGITLTDTIPEMQAKMAKWSYKQEIIGMDNKMELEGYERCLTPEQIAQKEAEGMEIIRQKDSRGNERVYWKEPEVEEPTITEKTQQYKAGLLADKADGMTYEEAIVTYSPYLDKKWIDEAYGKKAPKEEYEEKYYKYLMDLWESGYVLNKAEEVVKKEEATEEDKEGFWSKVWHRFPGVK